jgi:hypothetical protein
MSIGIPSLRLGQRARSAAGVLYNLLKYTEQFDNVIWLKNAATVTANQAVAPDGTTTMDTVTATAGSNVHAVFEAFTFTNGVQYTFSCYLKYTNTQFASLRVYDSSQFPHITFDLVNGTIVDTQAGATGTITSVGGGVYRITATKTSTATGTGNVGVFLQPNATNRGAAWVAAGTESVLAWGADLRVGASAGTYQKVAG